MPLNPGIPAPDFSLPDESGQVRRLADLRGRPVILYFYPKDDTPGCTTEACAFRDDYSEYVEADALILGISPDSSHSHTKFKTKFELPFPLLADEGRRVCELYKVWGPKKFMGREYEGVLRTTYLVNAKGVIVKVFENVKPEGHSGEVLAALKLV